MLRLTTAEQAIERGHDKVAHIWGGGVSGNLVQGKYDTLKVHAWFQNRHKVLTRPLVDADGYCRLKDGSGQVHSWKVPYGVRVAMRRPLLWAQIASKYPWYVTWQTSSGRRLKKKFESLASAIVFVTTRAQYVDPEASIISRTGYDIPPKLRGKLPHKKFGYWCPCCMTARKFYAVIPEQEIHVQKKVWDSDKGRYEYKLRRIRLLKCKFCGITNRDTKFRRSNQPWEVRKFKRGVMRAKRRRR